MSTEPRFSHRNRWFTIAVVVTALIAATSAAMGFVVLPSLQTNTRFTGIWDAICSAAGLVRAAPAGQPVVQANYKTTDVILSSSTLDGSSAISIGRGATLAMRCTMCHGTRGVSEADSPNLAGQYIMVIFKQLQDYKSGARTNAVMTPRVADLTDRDMRDLAAYYAYLPRLPPYHPATAGPAPQIVESGAPMRNIAPCATCHGTLYYKTGSAWLEGESSVYLQAQLKAFASGARHNDISEQMRNIARGMSSAEIEAAAQYYANQPQ
ncbi:c-type cytochrome [Acidisphaera sp. S103]|uniref:c-type cytochrome n=1 Tax=Acidisphaera sp. S103 TaxID=1747223 RepID=UPI00131CC380|nr:c-type cytochrome [Acidisphaera sp. S103]